MDSRTVYPALMKEADAEYRELHAHAIEFCNLDQGTSSSLDKDRVTLCKYVKQSFVNVENLNLFAGNTTDVLTVVMRQWRRIAMYQWSRY